MAADRSLESACPESAEHLISKHFNWSVPEIPWPCYLKLWIYHIPFYW